MVFQTVDELFEHKSVSEIEKEHKRILTVVEEKREELRSLVGERYRDLLNAADTISSMKESSLALIKQLEEINLGCNSLNEGQLIGFKLSSAQNVGKNERKQKFFSTVLQIKLLTVFTELIWTHIDKKNYSLAAALYMFSRHISTGFRLDTQNPFKEQFPVTTKQWNMLKSYYATIKYFVFCELKKEQLEKEHIADLLLCLLLLDNSDMNTVFKTFLSLRTSTYLKCIDESQIRLEHKKSSAKERTLDSLRILTETIELLNSCFMEGLLLEKLNELCGANSLPLLKIIEDDVVNFSHYLPELITDFRLQTKTTFLNIDQAGEELNKWLLDIELFDNHLKKLIRQIPSMEMLQEIQNEAFLLQEQYNFPQLNECLQTKELKFYNMKYAPLINERICEIIEEQWGLAVQNVLEIMRKYLIDIETVEGNIWKEDIEDLAGCLLRNQNNILDKKLSLKTKGYNSTITDICTTFDNCLKRMVSEIDILINKEATTSQQKNEICNFLHETTKKFILQMLHTTHEWDTSLIHVKGFTFMALCWISIIELCTHLKSCVSLQYKWQGSLLTKIENDSWKFICDEMKRESLHFWQLLLADIFKKLQIDNTFGDEILLKDSVNWEVIKNEENAQDIYSTFRIPSQPSISLQLYIFELIDLLNDNVPQVLPANMLQLLQKNLIMELLTCYQQKFNNKSNTNKETAAVQMFFDLCFLEHYFELTLQTYRNLKSDLNALQENFKSLVDPIDFELISDDLLVNVKTSISGISSLYGIFVINPITIQSVKSREKNANILPLSGCNPSLWFSSLPQLPTQKLNDL